MVVWFTSIRKFSASSYYPNRGDTTHVLAALDPAAHDSDTNGDNFEHEDDWLEDDEHAVGTARKVSARTSEAMVTEVSPQHPPIPPS